MNTTNPTRRRSLLIATALIATAAAAQWWPRVAQREVPVPDLGPLLPAHFAGWHEDRLAITQPISAADAAKAGTVYVQTVERVYIDAEQRRIMLSLAYGSQHGDRLQAHRPEFCYQAQGFTIGPRRDDSVRTPQGPLPVRRIETHRPGRHEPVSYWLTVGDEAALPGFSRKWAQLRQSLTGTVPYGVLVRISSLDDTPANAYALHDRFLIDLLSALPDSTRQYLAGRPRP